MGANKTTRAGGKHRTKLADAERRTPPADIGEFGQALTRAAFNGITEADVGEMMGNCMARAKEGSPAAIRFILELIGSAAKAAPARITRPVGEPPVAALALRRLCALHIDKYGPTAPAALAALCCLSAAELPDVVGCDWFDAPPAGAVRLTPTGRREAGM